MMLMEAFLAILVLFSQFSCFLYHALTTKVFLFCFLFTFSYTLQIISFQTAFLLKKELSSRSDSCYTCLSFRLLMHTSSGSVISLGWKVSRQAHLAFP